MIMGPADRSRGVRKSVRGFARNAALIQQLDRGRRF
jgi:hypothetical protein